MKLILIRRTVCRDNSIAATTSIKSFYSNDKINGTPINETEQLFIISGSLM